MLGQTEVENRIIFPGNEAKWFRAEHKGRGGVVVVVMVPADDTADSHGVSLPGRSCQEPGVIRGHPILSGSGLLHLSAEIRMCPLGSLLVFEKYIFREGW